MSKYCDYPKCTVIFNITWVNVMWTNVSVETGGTSTISFLFFFLIEMRIGAFGN